MLYKENDSEKGVFLSLGEARHLFPLLKKEESSISKEQRAIMLKIEKVLYENLSIREMEELL